MEKLVISLGSYPKGRGFESHLRYNFTGAKKPKMIHGRWFRCAPKQICLFLLRCEIRGRMHRFIEKTPCRNMRGFVFFFCDGSSAILFFLNYCAYFGWWCAYLCFGMGESGIRHQALGTDNSHVMVMWWSRHWKKPKKRCCKKVIYSML